MAFVTWIRRSPKNSRSARTKLLQVRAEMFNAFNHQRFAFPDLGSGDGALGQVTSTTNNFRRMQFGARFQF